MGKTKNQIFEYIGSRLSSGQGLIESALFFPVLLIVLSGMVEFGFLLNEYMAMQDAARNAARFASDGLFTARDDCYRCSINSTSSTTGCLCQKWNDDRTICVTYGATRDFYRQTACLVNQELAQERPEIGLNLGNGHDDIVISGFSITQVDGLTSRHPGEFSDAGWSEALDAPSWASRNQSSRFSSSDIGAKLVSEAPSTGVVAVEIFYDYEHKLKLPWITAFISDPLLLHNYTIMPLVSAEPTPTPVP